MADKFLIIDGSSLIHRAFFALPPLTNRKGQHTGAVYGFLRMFHKLLQDVQPRNHGRPSVPNCLRITRDNANQRLRN